MGVSESISMLIEASYSTAYILVPYLEMVVTTPFLLDSTLDGYHTSFDVYIMYFSVISKDWTLLDAHSYIVHHYQWFGKEINQDLQLFLWDTCGMVFA